MNYTGDSFWSWSTVDHRVDDWLLMSSFRPTLCLVVVYLTMSHLSTKWMENKKPWNIKWILVVYNILIAIVNLYIASQLILGSYNRGYNVFCEACHYNSTEEDELRIVKALHLYFMTKPMEWLDTVFLIVRKKSKQLSCLHIYHHSSIVLFAWFMVRYAPSGQAFLGAALNSIVHVIMYTYYGLSVFGPKFRKYLWWKRYLTQLQLVQFTVVIFHAILGILMECGYPIWLMVIEGICYPTTFLFLFGNFYKTTYNNVTDCQFKKTERAVDKQWLQLVDKNGRQRKVVTNHDE